ncbi:MAG: polyphenol oxidase family protein [Egibacteraceae bacterium]
MTVAVVLTPVVQAERAREGVPNPRGDLGDPLTVLREDPDARAVFAGRAAGNASLVVGAGGADGRRRVLGELGLTPADAVFMEQVHGAGVARVGHGDRGRGATDQAGTVPGVDALVTTDADVALVVLTADCVPLVLLDPGKGVAVAHAGRRGVQTGVTSAVVAALTAATGSPPARLRALIGPAISDCCYELPAALADEVAAAEPAARAVTSWGTPSLDLPAAVRAQLHAADVGRVTRVHGCTRCELDRWFSYRAAGQVPGTPPGRNATVICRLGEAARASVRREVGA